MGFWTAISTRFLGFGIFLCLFAILIGFSWSPVMKHVIRKEFGLRNNTSRYKNWVKPPIPMYMDFYFFNWTNPDKIYTEKPMFNEIGPYRYLEKRLKVNVTFNENMTVSYRIMRTWYFLPEQSYGTENDLVTTLNGVAVTGASKVMRSSYFAQKSLSIMLTATRQTLSVTRPLRQLLFEGYSDPLVTIGQNIPGANKSPYDKFGWFYGRNNSYKVAGYYNVATGLPDMSQLGNLLQWNYANKTKFYNGECAAITGSSGDLFPPGQTQETPISLFSSDVCRSLDLKYASEEYIYSLRSYRYEVDKNLLDNGTKVPGNECYCNGECVPSGLLNLTQCRYGAPAFISFPHFLHADQFYRDQVDGMKPDPKKHTFYMTLEPKLGIPIEGAARLQVNLLMRPVPNVQLFSDVPTVFIPVLWVEHKFAITNDIAKKLRLALMGPYFGYTFAGVVFICGVMMILFYLDVLRKKPIKVDNPVRNDSVAITCISSNAKDVS